MIIRLKRAEIPGLFKALEPLRMPTMKLNRSKAKFLKRLVEKDNETNEYRKELQAKYYEQVGDSLQLKKGVVITTVNQELTELEGEEVEIHGGEYQSNYTDFFEALNQLDIEISGIDAIFIDNLLEQYEGWENHVENRQ